MHTVTPEQAKETYEKTVRDCDRSTWATWIIAISNSVAAREWIGYEGCPDYAKGAFELIMAEGVKVSFSDSI